MSAARSRPSPPARPARRIDLFEIHDQAWCPAVLRQAITDCVATAWTFTGLWRNAVPHLAELLARAPGHDILDLCAGSGGPLPLVVAALAERFPDVRATLTDLHPKPEVERDIRRRSGGRIRYHHEPVDALDVPPALAGVRTIFGALHHFPPEAAARILASASGSGRPIAAFEFQRRDLLRNLQPPTGLVGLAPLVALVFAPWRWWRPLLTLLGVIPALWAWDSLASILRTYTPDELSDLARRASAPGYRFEVREAETGGRGRITCLLGFPDARGGVEVVRY